MYGLKDIAAPFIQYKNLSMVKCYKEARGLGMCGIYRLEKDGWSPVAKRYWEKFIHNSKIINR